MAEEILNLLAQVPDLLVPARTSSFTFKGKQTKIADIAENSASPTSLKAASALGR